MQTTYYIGFPTQELFQLGLGLTVADPGAESGFK